MTTLVEYFTTISMTLVEYFTTISMTVADMLSEHFGIVDSVEMFLICGVFVFCAILLALDCTFKAITYAYTIIGNTFFKGVKHR